MTKWAGFFLGLALLRHQLWELLPPEVQALAWNAAGAFVFLVLIGLVSAAALTRRTKFWTALMGVLAWWAYEEMMVLLCSGYRIFHVVRVQPGEAQCDAILGFPISAISIALVAGIGVQLYRETKNDKS